MPMCGYFAVVMFLIFLYCTAGWHIGLAYIQTTDSLLRKSLLRVSAKADQRRRKIYIRNIKYELKKFDKYTTNRNIAFRSTMKRV